MPLKTKPCVPATLHVWQALLGATGADGGRACVPGACDLKEEVRHKPDVHLQAPRSLSDYRSGVRQWQPAEPTAGRLVLRRRS
ncbi:hypothetical protein P7K49_027947 [Saguinus oedipus]|uniref:Secreted protein n=1 Tax=Saguinus oedipus TaxID=9490 RepID=A0ABQ9UBM6_SAGOE|nr:hypothetical protein P7K49_027947 [Saguinus oedipus]